MTERRIEFSHRVCTSWMWGPQLSVFNVFNVILDCLCLVLGKSLVILAFILWGIHDHFCDNHLDGIDHRATTDSSPDGYITLSNYSCCYNSLLSFFTFLGLFLACYNSLIFPLWKLVSWQDSRNHGVWDVSFNDMVLSGIFWAFSWARNTCFHNSMLQGISRHQWQWCFLAWFKIWVQWLRNSSNSMWPGFLLWSNQ